MPQKAVKRVLFVCTGNICRSPAAEAVFASYARETGLNIECDSAGTHSYHVGDAPDSRGIKVGLKRGYDMHDLRARKVTQRDFHDFDIIIAMDHGHFDILRRLKPDDAGADLVLFMEYWQGRESEDIPDPYYGDISDFEHMFDLVEEGTQKMLEKIS